MALERLSQVTDSGISTGIVLSNASVTGVLTATNEINVGSGLTLTSSAVNVTGAISGNQLNISGVSTFVGVGTFQNDLYVGGDLSVSGIITSSSDITLKDLYYTADYPTIRPSLDLAFAQTKQLDSRITFTRSSTGTYVGTDGLIKTAAVDAPRFDHDPVTGESLGLLIEESRTNILGNSTNLTDNNGNDWDNVNGTIAVNQTTAPDGTNTAASFTTTAGNAEHSVVWAELVPTGDVTASVWVKTNTYSIVSFVLYGEPNSLVSYNISTATVYNQASNVSRATIKEYPNGWYRISATMNCTVAASRVFRLFASTGNFNASGTESFYYWGPQVEAGSFETSYIPTFASNTSVTRSADIATITGTNFSSWYNQSEGTIFSNHRLLNGVDNNNNSYVYQIDDGTNNNVAFRLIDKNTYYSNPSKLTATTLSSAIGQFLVQRSSVTSGTSSIKVSYAAKQNDFSVSFDGSQPEVGSSGTLPGSQTTFSLGYNFPASTAYLNGHINRITYYPRRLNNSQLQNITL